MWLFMPLCLCGLLSQCQRCTGIPKKKKKIKYRRFWRYVVAQGVCAYTREIDMDECAWIIVINAPIGSLLHFLVGGEYQKEREGDK